MLKQKPLAPDLDLHNPAIERQVRTVLEGLAGHETLYGSMARRGSLKNWLIAALVAILAYQGYSLTVEAGKVRYIPLPVVQDQVGTVYVLGPPDPNWSPNSFMYRNRVEHLIQTTQGQHLDAPLQTKWWDDLLKNATERGQHRIEQAYFEAKKRDWRGAIEIANLQVLPLQEGVSYRATWTTQRYDVANTADTGPDGFVHWSGIFLLKFNRALASPANPTGIQYDTFEITREE